MSVVHIWFSFDPIAVKTEEKLHLRISLFYFSQTCHNEHYRDSFRTWKFFRHEQRNCVSCSQLEAKLTFSLCYIAHHLILTYSRILRKAAVSQFQDFHNPLKCNGSQLKNPDISCAIFELSLSKWILNSQCVEGARDVRVL